MPRVEQLNDSAHDGYNEDFYRARNETACNALLSLLIEHHPGQCPNAVVAYIRRLAATPDVPDIVPLIVSLPSEEDRIAVWVRKQKTLLPPKLRDWNVESAPTISCIQRIVCAKYNVTRADILSIRRTKDVVMPRQIAIYLSRMMTTRSFPYIGGKFGGRDHTTALHAFKKISDRIARDLQFASEMDALKLEIAGA